jgi:hypothetical protein
LNLKLNVFNGSNYKRDVEVYTTIDENKNGIPGKRIAYDRKKFTLPEAKFNEANCITYNRFLLYKSGYLPTSQGCLCRAKYRISRRYNYYKRFCFWKESIIKK